MVRTPPDMVPVGCNCRSTLREVETPCVYAAKSHLNSREERLTPQGGLKATMVVYVLNQDGHPLMPCLPAKARKLLQAGKARVVRRCPFTIQLNWQCEGQVQD